MEINRLMNQSVEKSEDGKLFCQIAECSYAEKKHFQKRKHLKQHLLKVHAVKKFKCVCSRAFSTKNFLLAHERQCGKEFKCYECDWRFNSREALLTHARRKNHKFEFEKKIVPATFTETQTEGRILNTHRTSRLDPLLYSHMYTQTCDEMLSELGLSDVQTQTTWPPPDLQDFLVSTETQTSFTQCLEEEMASFTTTHTQT
uniref:Uncharacterized protein n=1 Tax=Phlebotomus papatasi TaxID=29031 RepID=A0A1B0DE24_PHLPP